jgi:primosomal protein N' (replication factor Y)
MGRAVQLAGLSEKARVSRETIRRLQDKGLVEIYRRESPREAYRDLGREAPPQHTLTADQRKTLRRVEKSIRAREFNVFLIHGVTGSGKTEVYIRAIHGAIELGRGTIILVPEISLTPQTVSRFRAHFGDRVAVFHSGLSAGERYDAWRRTRDGRCRIVVGARSAVFAPLPDLGLIIVDEEHVDSYKQTEAQPRYHARDVAIMRAKLSKAMVMLGSATPSLESFHNVELKKFSYCSLPQRIDELPMPAVQIVDMCQEKKEDNWGIFSRILQEKIARRLEREEQIILFLNRRGFSTCIRCQECGFVMTCPHCNVTLTYHANDLTVKCHYCGFRQKAPHACPSCGGSHIKFRGTGTQRVEQEVRELFPRAEILRMDRDTTARRGALVRILERFRQGRANILLGTQMIAKGLDFPRVTLVGVVSADAGLNLPDFRSAERTFQLITQVAGRAGRSAPGGEVLVQTHSPDEIAIQLSRDHNYREFARRELASRKALGYPPFGKVILLLLHATEKVRVATAAEKLAELLRDSARRLRLADVQILGPAPAPLSKIRGQYRWQILLKGPTSAALHKLVRKIISRGSRWPPWPGVRVRIVVDPVEML